MRTRLPEARVAPVDGFLGEIASVDADLAEQLSNFTPEQLEEWSTITGRWVMEAVALAKEKRAARN